MKWFTKLILRVEKKKNCKQTSDRFGAIENQTKSQYDQNSEIWNWNTWSNKYEC